ncbi:MAG: hypothetical protein GC190_14200 [Alphaproteobacteria bacterium]|nr:hypothetical protein [Alphaproteobacteria bacterium]
MNKPLPIFAEGPSNVVKRLPYVGYDATLQGFVFQSNRQLLQHVCDEMINAPTGGAVKFRAVSSHVFLTALYQPRVQSDDPIDRTTGYVEEIDLAFWILAFGGKTDDLLGWRLRWLPVWLFVDTGSAIAAGREVFGYPKHQASFTRPINAPPDDAKVTVKTLAFVNSGPDERAREWPLVSLEPVDPSAQHSTSKPTVLDQVAAALREFLEGHPSTLGGSGNVFENLALPFVNMPMIFLKQFRDIHMPGRACFQAVTTVPVESRHIGDVGFFPTRYRLTINKAKSHPLEEVLGLQSGQESEFGFWLIQDFYVGFGETLWQA